MGMEINKGAYIRLKDGSTVYVRDVIESGNLFEGIEVGNRSYPVIQVAIDEIDRIVRMGRTSIG